MGKTLVYIALLATLGLGVYFFIFKDNNNLYAEKEANFTFRDTANIGKIFLVNNEGQSILLERNSNNKWTLNKKYPAMPIQIVNILTCLKLQTSLTPVSEVEHDRVVKLLAGLATKVELYNLKGDKIAAFYVGGQGPNYHGSYMIRENAQQAYLVEIPGFDGYLTPRYTVDINDWRSRQMIDWSMDSIATICINYVQNSKSSYKITSSKGTPILTHDPSFKPTSQLNVRRVLSYLGFFKNINAEGYLNGSIGLDTLIKADRLIGDLLIQNTKGDIKHFDFYSIPAKLGVEDENGVIPSDIERMYAVDLVTKDTLLVQNRTFAKLLRVASDFYVEGE